MKIKFLLPDSAITYFDLAKPYRDRGETNEAIRYGKKCLELEPNHGGFHARKARKTTAGRPTAAVSQRKHRYLDR